MGDLLGAGGYGEVYRAVWKGTDVAVKMISSEVATKEMQRDFVAEVRTSYPFRAEEVKTSIDICACFFFFFLCTRCRCR